MLSKNRIVISSAGSGKTTGIVERVLRQPGDRVLITTFTLSNSAEVRRKFVEMNGFVPDRVLILPWFTFVLRELVRPYQNLFYRPQRIRSVNLVSGRSDPYAPRADKDRYFFGNGMDIYSDKLSELAITCNSSSKGKVIERLEQQFDAIYVDEVQDLAGYDLDILRSFLDANFDLFLVSDHRQATLATNQSPKNRKYRYAGIIDLFRTWAAKGLRELEFNAISYRCSQSICDFSNSLFPNDPGATSMNDIVTKHDGVFVVKAADVPAYIKEFSPQALRYNRNTICLGYPAMNFRVSKGLSFERFLIFPHKSIRDYLVTSDLSKLKEPHLLYVAATRARQSVTFVLDEDPLIAEVERYPAANAI